MGFFSWFSSCGTVGEDEPPDLVQSNDDPDLDEIRQAAAEDIAQIEQDDKLYRGGSPDEGQDER